MDRQQKIEMLDRLEKKLEAAYYKRLQLSAPLSALVPGLEELMIESIPDSVGQDVMHCLKSGCTADEVKAALAVARQCAVQTYKFNRK